MIAKIIPILLLMISTTAAIAEKGPNVDEILFIHYQDENVAVEEVKNGNIDAYFWRIPLELATDLKDEPNINVYETIGGRLSILLNPAVSNDTFNPFSIREVRYAMNYLIDRELIVNEILKGSAVPSYSAFSQLDPDYIVLSDTIESFNFSYNPSLAEEIISNALEEHGAIKRDGVWYHQDKPITVKFFIRNDDPRRDSIGKIISSELEKIGFKVEEINGDLNKAQEIVYGSDPKNIKWHIYTEGWGSSAFNKYDDSLAAQMYAPWFAFMPGFKQEDYWNYENAQLDELTIKIFNGDYKSKGERDRLLNNAVKLGVSESVRIFIASTLDPYIASDKISGIITDFGAGITSRFTLINAKSNDGELKIGMKQIYQGSWNPVAGFKDWYSTRVWLAITDPSIFRNPHTGDVLPIRADWKVETEGPDGKLRVPDDAFIWDAANDRWINVGSNVNATSKVTYNLSYSKWHHNAMMDKNDILYSIYFLYEWGSKESEDDPTFDEEYAALAKQFINTIKGFRFIDDDTIEVYVDYWHFDENYIADYASIWSSTPWEIYAAMEDLVKSNKAAFSKPQATTNNVSWLSLLIKDDSEMLKESLTKFIDEKFIPKPLDIDEEYAHDRYNKAVTWIDTKKHAVVSNGPFYLDNYNPDARTITIKAFRDDTYPFEQDYWSKFEELKTAKISNIDIPLSVNRMKESSISGSIEYDDDYNNVRVLYFIKDGNGKISSKGEVRPDDKGEFIIELSLLDLARISTGSNELKVMSISDKALIPDIISKSFIALGESNIQVEEFGFNDDKYSIGVVGNDVDVSIDGNSLVLRLSEVKNNTLKVYLPRDVIDAKENGLDKPFVVMVDDTIVNAIEENAKERVLEIPLKEDSKEIRITGTQIVPEFGIIALLILIMSLATTILLTKTKFLLYI
ncbi:MAG: ABC transporter substrate-binding protein [Candidatus Nitrosocaldaceae archaeon]